MRTRTQWEAIVAAQIAPLNLSNSAAAGWKLLRDLVITLAMSLEAIYELFKKDVTDALENKQHGGLYWYKDVAKAYQHGDSLQVVNGVVSYAVPDAAKRIITQVSAKEILGDVLALKVAKTNPNTNQNEPLTAAELAGFRSYINARRLPGTRINAVSLAPDTVKYQLRVFHRPGFAPATLQADCLAALDAMRLAAPFDATLYRSDFTEALRHVDGVAGVEVLLLTLAPAGSAAVQLANALEIQAGYYTFDPASTLLTVPAP